MFIKKIWKISKKTCFFQLDHWFSYKFPKLPKKMTETSEFSLEKIFNRLFLSPKIDSLSNELFEYITKSNELKENFPVLLENKEIYTNFLILHVFILIRRISQENNVFAQKQAEKLIFSFKSNYFLKFAEIIDDHIPVQDFAEFYTQNYSNRYGIIEKELNGLYNQSASSHFSIEEEQSELRKLLRKLIFFNKFPLKHAYMKKMMKYYEAHINYLNSLTYSEIIEDKIYWGFIDLKLLEVKTQEEEHDDIKEKS